MKKKYRIIIDVTGEAPVVEAESVAEAEEKFAAGVTAEQLLELLKIGAAEMSEERVPGDARRTGPSKGLNIIALEQEE